MPKLHRNARKDSGRTAPVFIGTAAHIALAVKNGLVVEEGILWYDTTANGLKVYSGSAWVQEGAQSYAMTGAAAGEAIPDGVTHVAMTSANAAHWLDLPSPLPGTIVWITSLGGTGWELRTSDPATVALNGNTPTAGHESAVAATDVLTRCVCMSATTWIVNHFTTAGVESAADAAS